MAFELFTKNKNHHILYSLLNRKWAYISYIPEVYYKKKDLHYMLSHQNKREALIIGEIFHRLGYNVKVYTITGYKGKSAAVIADVAFDFSRTVGALK